MEYRTGDVIGAYRLQEQCGRGAFGQVFLAENLFSGQAVALKLLDENGKTTQKELEGLIRFRACRHPNLLPILHIDKVDSRLYYTMPPADNLTPEEDYCADTLAHRLSLQGPLPASTIMTMALELLAGLKELHRHELMHRDIKPDNILWIDRRAVLADVGLTRGHADAGICGSPGFMPDEVLAGERQAAAADDLYALGKVIYCALTGLGAEEFPRLSRKLSDPVAQRLFRTACMVCSKHHTIQNVAEFQNLLLTEFSDNLPRRIIYFTGIALTIIIAFIIFTGWRKLSFNPSKNSPVTFLSSYFTVKKRNITTTGNKITALPLPPMPPAVEYPMPKEEYPPSADAKRLQDLCIKPTSGGYFTELKIDHLDIVKENDLINKKFLRIQQRYTPELREKCEKRYEEILEYRSFLSFDPDGYAEKIKEFDQQHYYDDVLYRLGREFYFFFGKDGETGQFLRNLPRPEERRLKPWLLYENLFSYISAHERLDKFTHLLDFYDAHYQSPK